VRRARAVRAVPRLTPVSEETAERRHRVARMLGRDPGESHRGATPLELLFDLTFVIAFGIAGNELAHFLAEDHIAAGVGGFLFAVFAISWAWINFSWFASAYDTDDWVFRLLTMVQMVGVLILALGLPTMFDSLEHGEHVDNGVMVLGYVVMRVPMVFQWARAARQDPVRRSACRAYIVTITGAQAGWVALLFAHTSILVTVIVVVALGLVELAGPVVAETRYGGTPWHARHIAERYGLLVIITLGESLIGTMASLTALVGPDGPGWSADVALVGLAGTALTFGMWWSYFIIPSAEVLDARRERSFGWGYGHIPMFGAVVAVGAGLHVAAFFIERESVLGSVATLLTVAIPAAIFVAGVYWMYSALTRSLDPFHIALLTGTAVVLIASVSLAAAGASMAWCLLVLALTPWVTVLGYEVRGHRHSEEVLAQL
jgi:low temperature requirement protein LtrA